MEFKTVQDAFNHYRNASLEEIETRAEQIKGTIDNDPNADITTLNIQFKGQKEVKKIIKNKQIGVNKLIQRKKLNQLKEINSNKNNKQKKMKFEVQHNAQQ